MILWTGRVVLPVWTGSLAGAWWFRMASWEKQDVSSSRRLAQAWFRL